MEGRPACNACFNRATRLGKLGEELGLREKAVEEREVATALAEMSVEGRIREIEKKHKAEMRGYEGKIVETLYNKGYVQLEFGGGAVGTEAQKSVEWGERDRVEKTMAERETNVKKREREVEDLDRQRAQWEQAEKKKRLNLERDVMDRLGRDGFYISESGKRKVVSQAGLAEEIRARDAVMETHVEEADALREHRLKSDQEKAEYKKKLQEEKEKAAGLLLHAASLEAALKQRHREGSRIGRLMESEVAKARRATAALSSLTTLAARDQAALAKFRRARKTLLQHKKREATKELEELSAG